MENATKALIIAAAILIAIVLISLGVFVLGNGSQLVKENSDMSAEQVTAYNAEWEVYIGKATGSKVKQLINAVNQHNRTTDDASKKITLDGGDKIKEKDSTKKIYEVKTENGKSKIEDGISYTVSIADYTSAGLVSIISINQ